ncbi:MAG: DUF6273 domain-containing protein [Leptospirales bacterium]|nr:DUF6273 domain-containing protein [Leptospirales bacterium]
MAKKTHETMQFGPFEWLVLERKGNTALIIMKNTIHMGSDGQYHRLSRVNLELQGEKASSIKNALDVTWEDCDLRKVLHGIFLKEYFTLEERAKIVEVTNENPDNPWFKNPRSSNVQTARFVAGGKPTKDKVFLLSLPELFRYFGDSTEALNKPNFLQTGPQRFESLVNTSGKWVVDKEKRLNRIKQAKPNQLKDILDEGLPVWTSQFQLSDKNDENRIAKGEKSMSGKGTAGTGGTGDFTSQDWWLRTPGQSNARAIFVNSEGRVEMDGSDIKDRRYVRPALWLQM